MPRPVARLVCTDVRVRDLSRAIRFYRVLGLRLAARARMDDGTQLVWMEDRASGQLLELFHLSPRSPLYTPYRPQTETSSARVFALRDAGPILRRLRRLGGPVHEEFEDGSVRLTFLRDPDGAVVELVSWTPASRARHRGSPMQGLGTRSRTRRSGTR